MGPNTRTVIGAFTGGAIATFLFDKQKLDWLLIGSSAAVGASLAYNWNKISAGVGAARRAEVNPASGLAQLQRFYGR